jgi:hypothetical protein
MADSRIRYFAGLDPGQSSQYTGLAVLERTTGPDAADPGRTVKYYAVRHLERFPPGTPYAAVCGRLRHLFAVEPLAHGTLVVDRTAVGAPVVDLLRRTHLRAVVEPITITAGQQAHPDEAGGWSVPKKELVSTLQVLLQGRRIKVSRRLREAGVLLRELSAFRTKVSLTENDGLEAWREGPHDDLVLAVAVAAWHSERLRQFWIRW